MLLCFLCFLVAGRLLRKALTLLTLPSEKSMIVAVADILLVEDKDKTLLNKIKEYAL